MKKKFITAGVLSMLLAFSPVASALNADAQTNLTKSYVQLDSLAYSGDDLGAVYSKESTSFKVWAPTAEKVELKLYSTGSDDEPNAKLIAQHEMDYDSSNGVWSVTAKGNLAGSYYTYLVTANGKTQETGDVNAKAAGVNGVRSMVCDLSQTNPDGWESDSFNRVDKQTDAVIWEVHVKDFSSSASSGVSEQNRGKYLAFTETGTTLNNEGVIKTCVDYLKDLGVNYVHINPFYDYGSVDEASGDETQFNWGYDPVNYNVPEGSYSTNPYDGNVRIKEAKAMIQALHKAGIGVVMDVVYNHVFDAADSCFDKTVPGYYFRHNEDGSLANGSGCGNDTASERAMYRKYMVDSVKYWAQEYHIDGFRFDLMGLHDVDTMNQIREALDTLENGEKILMYGEAWQLSTSTDAILATQGNMNKLSTRIAAFNDGIRDGLKGSNFNPTEGGFVQGMGSRVNVKGGIAAATSDWAKQPSQTVTYTSCHDNMTLYDKLVASVLGTDADYRARDEKLVGMNKLAATAVLTAQGISFMLAGEEMARSKDGDHNSYKSSVELNQIDWSSLTRYSDLVKYYKGLISLRKAYSPFTCEDNSAIDRLLFYTETDKHLLGYMYQNPDAENEWDKVICLLNSGDSEKEVKLEGDNLPKDWVVVANGESAGVEKLSDISGDTVKVNAGEALILVDKASFEKAGIKAEKTSIDSLPDTVTATQLATEVAQSEGDKVPQAMPYIMGAIGTVITGLGIAYLVKRWRKNKKK
ncbi:MULTISPECIES: type I pullulanase [unclassified Ruminococcus]|uniref:type I pullulanase n=1 Tax=unclassified Ruminococcus TaxID=2608920 RepID=UPI00210B608B|nr:MULTISPECIES: type I pullulanase [unclassified Ruminococcus]